MNNDNLLCTVCPHECRLSEGRFGLCGARTVRDGCVVSENYGQVTALAFDPIEKKPLAMFLPGSGILSVSSWGCNMQCPWCQNDSLSRGRAPYRKMTPEEIAVQARKLEDRGNIGLAFTYNEPLIGPEFLYDTAVLVKEAGMKNVLVTNGMISQTALEKILPLIDAWNIDLKTFSEEKYKKIGGDLETVLRTIRMAAETAHVEVTTLIVPGFNDSEEEISSIAEFIAVIDPAIPLHVTRFYPAGEMTDAPPTPVKTVYRLAELARNKLKNVFVGNC